MATYILLMNFTDQGIRSVKDTTKRSAAITEAAGKKGITLKDIYWTVGQYDLVATVEAPDDEAMTALALGIGVQGNVRTQTMRAFNKDEMARLLSKL